MVIEWSLGASPLLMYFDFLQCSMRIVIFYECLPELRIASIVILLPPSASNLKPLPRSDESSKDSPKSGSGSRGKLRFQTKTSKPS